MKKLLMITSRNILTSCGELRLIKNRAEHLFNDYNISTDFITFGTLNRINSERREKINAGGKIQIIPVLSMTIVPIIIKKALKYIENSCNTNHYAGIILSGVGTLRLARIIKKKISIDIYCDVHGALEDTYELAKTGPLIKRLRFLTIHKYEKYSFEKYAKNVDGYLVVTDALGDYLKNRFILKKNVKFFIIPCATSSIRIEKPDYISFREKYRKKYNIDNDTKVFIYSGGVSTWQCIEETVQLYKELDGKLNMKTKLLMFSHNIETLKKIIGESQNIEFDSYYPEELERALCAGDFAFLLRKDCVTNNVAFPNKYLEYVRSNLAIITTPYVYEVARQVKKYESGFIYNMYDDKKDLIRYIEQYTRCKNAEHILQLNSFNHTLEQFVEDIVDGAKN